MRGKLFACATAAVMIGIVGCDEVIGPVGDPVNLSYAPCLGGSDNPSWFAYQDGGGSWQRVTASASGSFDFTVRSGKAGIAMYYPDGETTLGLYVVYATTEELQANLPACNGSARTLAGTATGYTSADNVALTIGTSGTAIYASTVAPPAPFSISAVDLPATDLIGVRYRVSSGGAVAYDAFPNNIFLRRNVTGSTTGVVDFGSTTEAGAPVQRTVNVTNLLTGDELNVTSHVALKSTTATIAKYEAYSTFISGSATGPFWAVPSARLNAGETQFALVGAVRDVSTSVTEGRFATFVFNDPVDRSLTLGPTLGPVTVTGGSRPTASYNVQSGYDNLFDVVFQQGNGDAFRQIEVLATTAYLDGATAVTLAVPNLVGVAGFSSGWLMVPGVSSVWQFLASDADLSTLNAKPVTYQGADRASVFTP